jgi:hypothetical protein
MDRLRPTMGSINNSSIFVYSGAVTEPTLANRSFMGTLGSGKCRNSFSSKKRNGRRSRETRTQRFLVEDL